MSYFYKKNLVSGFGFLKCVEREARLFFHFNEVLDVDREICLNDEFEFTVIQDQTSSFSNNRQSAIRMKRMPNGTVKFETLVETSVMGVISKEVTAWISRSPTKNQNGTNGNAENPDTGIINYNVNGTKKTISFYLKDQRTSPRVGDKVIYKY